MKNKSKNRNRSAMTIIETGFAIIIGLVVIAGSIAAYKKMYIPMKGDSAYSQVSSVIGSLERVKMTNNSVYPAGSSTLSALTILQNELGGEANSRDVANWTYSCTAGATSTVTLKTTTYDNDTVADIAALKVSNALAPWVATSASGVVTATLANVVCK